MKWFLLGIGIFAEVIGSTFMKMSKGFTKVVPSIFTFIFWAVGLSVFILALKKFDLSFAYAIWAGLGIMFISIIGIIFYLGTMVLLGLTISIQIGFLILCAGLIITWKFGLLHIGLFGIIGYIIGLLFKLWVIKKE